MKDFEYYLEQIQTNENSDYNESLIKRKLFNALMSLINHEDEDQDKIEISYKDILWRAFKYEHDSLGLSEVKQYLTSEIKKITDDFKSIELTNNKIIIER